MRHLASTRRAVMALVLAMSSRAWGEAGVGVAVTMTAEELQAMNGSPVDATSTDRDGLVAMGYTLVEDTPRCYFVLGSNYCPAPGALFLESVSQSTEWPILGVCQTTTEIQILSCLYETSRAE